MTADKENRNRPAPFSSRLLPLRPGTGFRMDGYFIWCGSVIYAEGAYHIFASRWEEKLTFPSGYMVGSEIVHGVADGPEGPFTYAETVIGQRGGDRWDSQFAHNPQIVKCGDVYVLYYIGAVRTETKSRRIGYAFAESVGGPWVRSDAPIDLGRPDCNNPAAWVEDDGSVLLAFRYGNQRIGVARAPRYDGAYTVINEDILPGVIAEDPFLWKDKAAGRYRMLVEDGRGTLTGGVKFGALLESEDGKNWKPEDPVLGYDHTLRYADGTVIQAERRERPQLLLNGSVIPTHLYTGVLYQGRTWNAVQRIGG